MDGRILEDESRRAMPPAEFALEAGGAVKKPFKHILLEEKTDTSLEELLQLHGSTDARTKHSQALTLTLTLSPNPNPCPNPNPYPSPNAAGASGRPGRA